MSEGIASSLRHFSFAQARCAAEDGAPSRPASSRQRSAAAAGELLSMNKEAKPRTDNKSGPPNSDAPSKSAPEIRKVITVNTLRGGALGQGQGRFTGVRRVNDNNEFAPRAPRGPSATSGGIITGGIIRGSFAGRRGGSFASRGDGESRGNFQPARGPGRGRGRGQSAKGGRRDDRPVRPRKVGKDERDEEQEYLRFKVSAQDVDPQLTSYIDARVNGVDRVYNPTAPKDLFAELGAYAPAIATNASPLAKTSTIINQAVMLGGGRPFHPEDVPLPAEAQRQYQDGHGVFFPSAEAKASVAKITNKVKYANPPDETVTAVLDSAILGKYDGPKFAPPSDSLGTVRSYVKRHGTWNAEAERNIEAKVKSLLPVAKAKGGPKGGAAKPQAKEA